MEQAILVSTSIIYIMLCILAHNACWFIMQWQFRKSGKASSCLHLAINPFERPTIAGALSVVTDTNFHTRSWVYSIKLLKD